MATSIDWKKIIIDHDHDKELWHAHAVARGFKFNAEFYYQHSQIFRNFTTTIPALKVGWRMVLSHYKEIREQDLHDASQSLITSGQEKNITQGEKLLVSVELLGNSIPVFKYLISSHRPAIENSRDGLRAGNLIGINLSNAKNLIHRLVNLGSLEALERATKSCKDGSYGFISDPTEYEKPPS